jgi:superfamily II DNA/RNA helicase
MGFIPDIERIFKLTPPKRQTLFFSATMPPEIARLTAAFLKDPTRIEVARQATTGENISQYVTNIPMSDPKAKRTTLRALVGAEEVNNGIVFCNRKTDVDIVAKSLKKYGFDAGPIHGDLDQSTRMKTLESFRKGELKLLVASDVAARGLDIPAVSHVFNYDVPYHAEDYVHRIGRTGRAGRLGKAFMIVTPSDAKAYDKVLKLTKKEPEEFPVELDWSEVREAVASQKARGDAKGGRGGRGERSDRGGRGDRSSSRVRRTFDEAGTGGQPEVVDAAVSVEVEEAPRRKRPERAPRAERAPRPERAPRETPVAVEAVTEVADVEVTEAPARRPSSQERLRPVRGVQTAPDRDHDDRSVVGFGQDIPAFLARPVPAPAPSKKSAAEED